MTASKPAPSASSGTRACITPERMGAVAFLALEGKTPDERSAVAAAHVELERVLEHPREFFGTVVTTGDLVLLELWHASAFLPQNCELLGNVGEKGRTLAYDPRLRRIVSTKVWQ